MVSFGLIGVGPGELGKRPIQLVVGPCVAGDHGSSARSGVTLGQRLTDDAGVVRQRRRIDRVQRDGAFILRNCRTLVLQQSTVVQPSSGSLTVCNAC